jgi:hypothetical protein
MVETALRPVLLCPKGGKQVRIGMKGGPSTSVQSTVGSLTAKEPKDCFKTKKGVVRDEVVDLSSLLSNLKKAGTYQVQVAVTHVYTGQEHGLDAWTGVVFSAPMDIRLPITAASGKVAKAPSPQPKAAESKKSKKSGCACDVKSSTGQGLPLTILLLVFLLVVLPVFRNVK